MDIVFQTEIAVTGQITGAVWASALVSVRPVIPDIAGPPVRILDTVAHMDHMAIIGAVPIASA